MCVFSLWYPTCTAHERYYIVICGLSGFTISLSTFSHKRHDFRKEKRLLNIKCVFPFSLQFCLKYCHYKKEWARSAPQFCWSSCIVAVVVVVFYWNLNFLERFSEILKHQLLLTSVQWEQSCSVRMGRRTQTDRQTDRHNEANSRFWQLCERAKKQLTKDLNLCMAYRMWQKCGRVLSVFSWNGKKHTQLCLEFKTGQR